jgi:hypothetical protein
VRSVMVLAAAVAAAVGSTPAVVVAVVVACLLSGQYRHTSAAVGIGQERDAVPRRCRCRAAFPCCRNTSLREFIGDVF